jgi:hypothetical protein
MAPKPSMSSESDGVFADHNRLEETWPKDRTFEAFQRWFDYSSHSMIFDLADQTIEPEEI